MCRQTKKSFNSKLDPGQRTSLLSAFSCLLWTRNKTSRVQGPRSSSSVARKKWKHHWQKKLVHWRLFYWQPYLEDFRAAHPSALSFWQDFGRDWVNQKCFVVQPKGAKAAKGVRANQRWGQAKLAKKKKRTTKRALQRSLAGPWPMPMLWTILVNLLISFSESGGLSRANRAKMDSDATLLLLHFLTISHYLEWQLNMNGSELNYTLKWPVHGVRELASVVDTSVFYAGICFNRFSKQKEFERQRLPRRAVAFLTRGSHIQWHEKLLGVAGWQAVILATLSILFSYAKLFVTQLGLQPCRRVL